MSTPTLYELSLDARAVYDALADCDDPEAVRDTLEAIQLPVAEKAVRCVKVMRSLAQLATDRKAEAARMAESARHLERGAEWLEGYVLTCLLRARMTTVEAGPFTLTARKNPPKVIIEQPEAIPPRFQVIVPATTRPDKIEIKAAIEAGEQVPGAHLESTMRLDVR